MQTRQRNAQRDPTPWPISTRHAWLVIVACGLLLSASLLWRPVTGHSYPLNLSWHEGFVAELRAGTLYPRWLNSTNQGLGAPSFYFYAPLPFFVSGLLDLISPLRLGTAGFVYASAVIAVVCSGLTMFAYVRRLVAAHAALLSAIAYMSLPYHLGVDLWWRAALGELWAFVWPPLVLAGVARQWRGERWGREVVAVGWAGLMVSHLPSLLIVLCGATCAAVAWHVTATDRSEVRRIVAASGAAFVVALALSSPYWFPAVATLGYTDITRFMTSGWFLYSNNFVLPYTPGSWNGTIEMLLLVELLAVCGLVLIAMRTQRVRSPAFRIGAACVAAAVFVMTPASDAVWRLLPPLQRVQFPWRFHLLIDVSLAVMLAVVLDQLPPMRARPRRGIALSAVCFCVGIGWSIAFSPEYSASVERDLRVTRATRADANEYRTRWTPTAFFYAVRNGDTLVSRRVSPDIASADAHGMVRLDRQTSQPFDLVLNRFWYPSLRLSDADDGRTLDTRPQTLTGLAMVRVPAGVGQLHAKTTLLREEKLAWIAAGATLLLVLGWLWRARVAARA